MIEIFITKVDGYFRECHVNMPIYTPITDNIYYLEETSEKGKNFLTIFKNKLKKKSGVTHIKKEDIEYKLISFEYKTFLQEFKQYEDFRKIYEIVKLEKYKSIADSIYVEIAIKESLI